jgi:lipid II:glycine glycyltransferase (peptidoglycan interpeptide bridge formation enzyme)
MDMSYESVKQLAGLHTALFPFPGINPDYVIADAKRDERLFPNFFVRQEGDHIYYHAFHTRRIADTAYFEIISQYGYGGPFSTSNKLKFLKECSDCFKVWCHDNNVVVETIRFHPLLENFKYYHGDIVLKRNTVYVDLRNTDLLADYSARTRTAIRKAIKNNAHVNFLDPLQFLEVFPQLYGELMIKLKARKELFFNPSYFHHLCHLPNAVRTVVVHDGQVIAAALFFIQNDILEYHLSASNAQGRVLCANNLLLHEAFLYAKKQGCSFCHLGGGVTDASNDPLLFFKLGFNGKLAGFKIGKYVHDSKVYESLLAQNFLQVR